MTNSKRLKMDEKTLNEAIIRDAERELLSTIQDFYSIAQAHVYLQTLMDLFGGYLERTVLINEREDQENTIFLMHTMMHFMVKLETMNYSLKFAKKGFA